MVQALEEQGWMPEETAADEWMVWRRAGRAERVLVNPFWERIYEGDPIFRCLCRDMALNGDELVALLQSVG